MFDTVMQMIAPHHCFGCGRVGSVLREHCYYDISNEPFCGCIVCTKPTRWGICAHCKGSFSQAWCIAFRRDVLEEIIDAYKFQRLRAAFARLADLLDDALPQLPADTIIVPIPTLPSHIRQRGHDHTKLIARSLGKKCAMPVVQALARRTRASQRHASRGDRIKNAKAAFMLAKPLEAKKLSYR